jgi:hypothetical protein
MAKRIEVVRPPRRKIMDAPVKDPNCNYRYASEKNIESYKQQGYEVCNLKGEAGSTHKSREMYLMKCPKGIYEQHRKEHDDWVKVKSGEYRETARKGRLVNMRDKNYSVRDGKVSED